MTKSGLSKSLRVHVRREKARIRREFFDPQKQQELIAELYKQVFENSQKKQTNQNELQVRALSERTR